jgi:LacI family transcriptional regulator
VADDRAAARAERIAIDPALVGQLTGNSPLPDLGYRRRGRCWRVRPRATALFAFNDISAMGAIRAHSGSRTAGARGRLRAGLRRHPERRLPAPGLTTIRQPLYEMGQRAADTLVGRIERPGMRCRG